MNKYFLFTAALLFLTLVTGCQKEGGVPDGDSLEHRTQINISLDGVEQSSETKAAVADIDIDAKGFTIAGYYTVGVTAVDGSVTTSGNFATQIATTKPNVFDLEEISTGVFHPAVRTLKKDAMGKYHVLLSKWALLSESYLSYVAWSVATDAAVGAAGNPITSATAALSVGRPFIAVAVDGKTDIVTASSLDNRNDVVRGAIDLDFKHIFSKLRFHAIAASTTAAVTVTSAQLIANASISKSARYDFNLTGGDVTKVNYAGSWGAATSTAAATYPLDLAASVAVTSGEAKFLTDRLVIPQTTSRGDFSVELTYTLANGSTTSTYTRTVALPAQTLLQNTSYTYTFRLSEDRIEVGTCNIGKWIIAPSAIPPQVAGPRGDVILLLDASEPPYVMADGTRYWLDRSGYNNHAKVHGNTAHDGTNKCYSFFNTDAATDASLVTLPNLGDYSNGGVTAEFVAHTWATTNNRLFQFSYRNNTGEHRTFFTHFHASASNGTTYFDAGSIENETGIVGSRLSALFPSEQRRGLAFYSYSYDAGADMYQHIMRNMTKMAIGPVLDNSPHKTLRLETGEFGRGASAAIHYFKVTKKAKRTIDLNEYKELAKKFKFPVDSYVQDGLLIDLQGVTPISTYKGKQVWIDNSINENHAEIINPTTAGITHDPATKCYQFTGVGYMQFMREIAKTGNDMTIEVVVKSTNPADGLASAGCVVQFNTQLDGTGGAWVTYEPRVGLYWPYSSGASGTFLIEAAHASGGDVRFNEINSNFKLGSTADKASISFIRSGNTLSFRHNGNDSGLGTRTNTTALPAFKVGRVGAQTYPVNRYIGHIYAIRLYNRTLTDAERAANYELDKKTYNL